MRSSIIIRLKNEKKALSKLLSVLRNQSDQDFEIVIVDDHSTDGGERVVFDFFPSDRVKVVDLPGSFSYPYSSNYGAEHTRGKYLVYLSAHSLPYTETWLQDGIDNFERDKTGKLAGVWAVPKVQRDGTLADKLTRIPVLFKNRQKRVDKKAVTWVMGATNAIFRRDLWKEHNFDLAYKDGGEDTEWAHYWHKKGYFTLQDPKFSVYHSHYASFYDQLKAGIRWKRFVKELHKN